MATAAVIDFRSSSTTSDRERVQSNLRQRIEHTQFVDSEAAQLGLKRPTLQSRMRKFNIARLYQ